MYFSIKLGAITPQTFTEAGMASQADSSVCASCGKTRLDRILERFSKATKAGATVAAVIHALITLFKK